MDDSQIYDLLTRLCDAVTGVSNLYASGYSIDLDGYMALIKSVADILNIHSNE